MATVAAVLTIARGELGVSENPPGSNNVKYWSDGTIGLTSMNGNPWCAAFVLWVLTKAKADHSWSSNRQFVGVAQNDADAQRAGLIVKNPKPGDLVVFTFSHIGFVESVNSHGSLTTIEGNTDSAGGRTGGKVMRHQRARGLVRNFIRPKYTA